MRILFIIPTYKPAYVYGGPVVVVSLLAETLAQLGHDVTVYATTANGKDELSVPVGKTVMVDGVRTLYFRRITKDHTHISFSLWRHLYKTATDYDVIHIHSWWSPLVMGCALICRRKKVKPVLSPHGMFSNYVLTTNNAGIKKWMQKLFGRSLLSNTWLHATSQMEWEEAQRICHGWKGEIIPNLVLLPSAPVARQEDDVFTIGFLSRIDPKKGLDILIRALSRVSFPYRLLVGGDGEPAYVKSLQALANASGNSDRIVWAGWKNGDEKFTFLSGLDLFSLISHSENFAISIIESLSVGTPVLISHAIGLATYIEQQQLGWIATTEVANVAAQLEAAYHDEQKRKRIESTGSQIVEQHFDKTGLGHRYADFYSAINSVQKNDVV